MMPVRPIRRPGGEPDEEITMPPEQDITEEQAQAMAANQVEVLDNDTPWVQPLPSPILDPPCKPAPPYTPIGRQALTRIVAKIADRQAQRNENTTRLTLTVGMEYVVARCATAFSRAQTLSKSMLAFEKRRVGRRLKGVKALTLHQRVQHWDGFQSQLDHVLNKCHGLVKPELSNVGHPLHTVFHQTPTFSTQPYDPRQLAEVFLQNFLKLGPLLSIRAAIAGGFAEKELSPKWPGWARVKRKYDTIVGFILLRPVGPFKYEHLRCPFGPFYIMLSFPPRYSPALTILPHKDITTWYTADYRDGGDGPPFHPHIRASGHMCLGDGEMAITASLAQGEICSAIVTLKGLLEEYNRISPFFRIDDFAKTIYVNGVAVVVCKCHDCMTRRRRLCICCYGCNQWMCQKLHAGTMASEPCPECHRVLCNKCLLILQQKHPHKPIDRVRSPVIPAFRAFDPTPPRTQWTVTTQINT